MSINEHQLKCIYYIFEKEFSNAKENLKKANDVKHGSPDEWYFKGRMDAFEVAVNKLGMIFEDSVHG